MERPTANNRTPVVVIALLVAVAVIAAGVRGSMEVAVPAVLVGSLLIAYFVRHRMRARLLYDGPADRAHGDGPADTTRSRSRPISAAQARDEGAC